MKPVKKNRIGLKVTALALCCALLGGAVGGGIVWGVGRSGDETSVNVSGRTVSQVALKTVDGKTAMSDAEVYAANVNSVVSINVTGCEGVGMDVVGIDGGVVRVLRKLLRFVLARLMGKPRQLLFAAVMGAVRQPLERQKPMLIAVSKIILVAERAFAVLVRAMVNGLSVDGAAADGDVFRRGRLEIASAISHFAAFTLKKI